MSHYDLSTFNHNALVSQILFYDEYILAPDILSLIL